MICTGNGTAGNGIYSNRRVSGRGAPPSSAVWPKSKCLFSLSLSPDDAFTRTQKQRARACVCVAGRQSIPIHFRNTTNAVR